MLYNFRDSKDIWKAVKHSCGSESVGSFVFCTGNDFCYPIAWGY